MDRPCESSWTGAHENFQAREYDAGASPTSKRAWGKRQRILAHDEKCLKCFEVGCAKLK
jgi:hypothetical protein